MAKTTLKGRGGMGIIVVWNRIPQLIAAVEVNSRMAVKKYADKVVSDAKARAPVRTGYLRSSIHAVSLEAGKSAEVQVDAPYGAYVEYGTYKMAAQPYLGPAVAANEKAFFDACGRGAVKF
jgi:phage protein, HK97 gp10 family